MAVWRSECAESRSHSAIPGGSGQPSDQLPQQLILIETRRAHRPPGAAGVGLATVAVGQTPEENTEAVIRDATLIYSTDSDGRLRATPRA